MQMTFYCDLYIAADLEQKKQKIIQKLKINAVQPSIYIITLAQGIQNHLEFYSSLLLKQHYYEDTPLFVVGIARGYDGALCLAEHIIREIYEKTEDTDIRNFIVKRQKQYEEGSV